MKKLLSLLALLLTGTIGAVAQVDWPITHADGNPQDKTVIIADLVINNGAEWEAVYGGQWTIGAFVGDDCRLTVADNDASVLTTEKDETFLTLPVPGNYGDVSDNGKAITIRVYNSSGAIYTITPDMTLTWNPETTIGSGSGPRVQLKLTLPTSVTLAGFGTNVGETVNLNSMITKEPADAQLPENVVWGLGNGYWDEDYNDYATIDGNNLKAVKPYIVDGENTSIPYNIYINSGNYMPLMINGDPIAPSQFYIYQPANSLTIETEKYSVFKDRAEDLTMFMRNGMNSLAYSTDPAVITETVMWEVDSEYITESDGTYTPIKGGETRIRPYIERAEGNLYPADNKWITINIIVPVDEAYLNWPVNDGQDKVFKANVGDEGIYEHLAKYVTILPDDATDKTFTITDASENEGEFFEVDSENKIITALKAGRGKVKVQPNGIGGEDLGFEVIVEIYDPLKEISFTEDPLIFRTDENPTIETIEQAIADNITNWLQDGPRIQEGTITVEGVLDGSGAITGNGPIVSLTNKEVPKGESTVTVTLRWNDYSEYDGNDGTIKTANNGGQSFTVKIIVGLESFTIVVTPNDDDPNRGTITVTPVPEDAVFDWADYEVTVGCDDYDGWDAISIKGDEGSYDYAAQLPGEYYVTIDSENYKYFTVPEKVSFEAGWQWKSNPWGIVEGNKKLYAFFGDNLAEARTYNELLFNDAEWGYWGSLYTKEGYAIDPYQMYKVKMKAADEAYLYNGDVADEIVYSDLAKGWNWIGSPYFYKRLIEKAFNTNYAANELVEGMVIQSKTGSAEFNGSTWSGQLKTIDPGQGYYLYLPEDIDVLHLAREISDMEQGDDVSAARGARQSVWSYDHSRFASNMSVVAELSDLTNAEQFTIGAFVGDECRGEGIFEKGLAFITVHTDGGEQVSFRLHNELTGEFFDIDQTIRSGAIRVGSLKAPVQLTSQAVVTGVKNIENGKLNIESYDLGGRRVNNSQSSILNSQLKKGLTIQRRSDGSVRKVVK